VHETARVCWAAVTRGSVLPGCDDGDGRLRALLRADAARFRFVMCLHMFISFRCSRHRYEFSLRGHVQRDQQQLVPVSQRSRAGPARFGRCVAPLGFGFLRRRLRCVELRVCAWQLRRVVLCCRAVTMEMAACVRCCELLLPRA
jgi:hypothetical protein